MENFYGEVLLKWELVDVKKNSHAGISILAEERAYAKILSQKRAWHS